MPVARCVLPHMRPVRCHRVPAAPASALAGRPLAPLLSRRREVTPRASQSTPRISPARRGVLGSRWLLQACVPRWHRAWAGRGGWEHDGPRRSSLSLFSSQDLKFNYISKEINFKVTFYARVQSVHCRVCAACHGLRGGRQEPLPLPPQDLLWRSSRPSPSPPTRRPFLCIHV